VTGPVLGYRRRDGRVGIRDVAVVVYLVECARQVAEAIATGPDVHPIGFGGCYPSAYAQEMLERLCTHPNVGAVALVSLGCEGFDRERLADVVAASGRPVTTLVIQRLGGTRATVAAGRAWIAEVRGRRAARTAPLGLSDLVVGTICGGSDGTSGITANPVVGRVVDRLVAAGGTAVFEETGELVGCEHHMAQRAVTPELGIEIAARVAKAADYYTAMGHGSFAPGNAEGGLTTLEEKSLGAYSKSGSGPIHGVVTPGQLVPTPGLYLLDVVPEGTPRWGYPNICANPETYRRMGDDMDVDAGRILEGRAGIDDVADELLALVLATAAGAPTASEDLGHQEFVLTYKSSEPTGPGCLPMVR